MRGLHRAAVRAVEVFPIPRGNQRRQYGGANQTLPRTSVAEDSNCGSQDHPRRGRQTVERLCLGGRAEGRRAHSAGSGNRSSGQARPAVAQRHRRPQPMKTQTLPHGRGSDRMPRLQSEPRPSGSVRRAAGITLLALSAAFAQPGQLLGPAQQSRMQDSNLKPALPGALEGVGIDQRLDQQVSRDLMFKDEAGRDLPLSPFFQRGKPVILAPVYYRCPMLCTQILNGLASSLKAVSLDPGKDFEIVAVSFDPKDTPETAAGKKQMYLRRYGRPGTANGWHLLTGGQTNITALMDAIGYHYKYDAATGQFAHASGIMVLTPEGRLSRYFYGVEYAPRDVRLGLVEASQNKIGGAVDQILLFCFHYEPATGKYGAVVMNLVRFAGASFTLVCGVFLFIFLRRDVRRDRRILKRVG